MTTQKDLIQELTRTVEKYRNFISEISEGVWRIEMHGPVRAEWSKERQIDAFYAHAYLAECNEAMARMYGYGSAKELEGKFIRELLLPDDPRNYQMLAAFIEAGFRLQNAELVERDRHGNIRYFVNNLVGDIHDGQLESVWGTQRDITSFRELENRLKSAASEAEGANRAKSRFLANVSHEIRTPLGVILGFADLALDSKELSKEARGYVQAIRRNGQQLAELLGEVLDLSKIEASQMEIENIRFALGPFLKEIISSMGLNAREKGLKLNFQRLGELPKYVRTDPTKLRQILINLLGNAIKFTESGSVTLQVRMISEAVVGTNVRLEFTVIDTGIGISEGVKERLFQPFVQAEAAISRKYGGTGLGLSLSRELACALGGSLALSNSEVGKGSTFVFTLTCGDLEPDFVMHPSEGPCENSCADHLSGKRVLLVEDSEDNQVLISRYLTAAGLLVEIARNGYEGIEMARSGVYDLVVMDIQMPGVDGHEAARAMRASGFQKPIIALTAHAFKEDRDRAFANGFNEYLTKPINRAALLRTLDQRLTMSSIH